MRREVDLSVRNTLCTIVQAPPTYETRVINIRFPRACIDDEVLQFVLSGGFSLNPEGRSNAKAHLGAKTTPATAAAQFENSVNEDAMARWIAQARVKGTVLRVSWSINPEPWQYRGDATTEPTL